MNEDDFMVVPAVKYQSLVERLEKLATYWETNQCVSQRTYVAAATQLRNEIERL